MKKMYVTVIAVFVIVQFSYGQWNPVTGGIYYNAGNIGVGTPNPIGTIDVNSSNTTIRLRNNGYTIGRIDATANNLNFDSPFGGILTFSTINSLSIDGSGMERMRIDPSGNVGIGTTNPLSTLNVNGNIAANASAGSVNSYLLFQRTSDGYVGARLGNAYSFNGYGGHLVFETNDGAGLTSLVERMRITNTGNVGIGTTNPQNKLDVKGTIHSQQVNVDMNGWSDYVFKKGYGLPTLSNVKTYIDKNHHLPEIPSAKQIEKDGLNLGEMNKLLVKKVEELTLYLIEKDKDIKDQQAENRSLNEKLKQLEGRVTVLETAQKNK